jgi:hypothetical protein
MRGLVIAAIIMIVVGLIVYAIGIFLVFNATVDSGSTELWITIFLALITTMIGIVLLIVGENR